MRIYHSISKLYRGSAVEFSFRMSFARRNQPRKFLVCTRAFVLPLNKSHKPACKLGDLSSEAYMQFCFTSSLMEGLTSFAVFLYI